MEIKKMRKAVEGGRVRKKTKIHEGGGGGTKGVHLKRSKGRKNGKKREKK